MKNRVDIKSIAICFAWLILSCIIMAFYNQNINMLDFGDLGFIDVYYLIMIGRNPLTYLLIPLIPILINTKNYLGVQERIENQESWLLETIKFGLNSGLIIVVMELIIFISVVIVFPNQERIISIDGMFADIARDNPAGYLMLYFINSFVFFVAYSWIGLGVFLISKSIYLTLIFAMLIYQGNRFVAVLNSISWLEAGVNQFPFFAFEIGSFYYSVEKRIGDFIILILLACCLISVGQYLIKKRSML